MAERIIDQLSPASRKRYEAFVASSRGVELPEWATLPISIKSRRSFCKSMGVELPEKYELIEAVADEASSPIHRDMYRYIYTTVPIHAEEEIKALSWVFPASWAEAEANDMEAYKEAYLKGYSYFFDDMRDEDLTTRLPFALSAQQEITHMDEVAKEHITPFLEYRLPRIEKKLQQAIKKAVVLLFVADNVDETGVGQIYWIAKQNGLRAGKTLTPKNKKALNEIAEVVAIVVEFWALNFCKWVACYIRDDEEARQYISEAEADEHNVNAYLFNEVAAVFGLFITAYHKAAVAGIQNSGEDYLSVDFEALLPAFAEEWEATERMGGYNALLEKVRNSRYNDYYTKL